MRIVDLAAAEELRDEMTMYGDTYTTEEAIDILIDSGCACDEPDDGQCMHCDAMEACGWWWDGQQWRLE